jgi:uncharacterized alpha-E superfamily protein
MLSRVANSIFWLNRYMERAENYARFISVNYNLSLDMPQNAQQWEPLVIATADQALFKAYYQEATANNVIRYMSFDEGNPNSLLNCLRQARENARTIREAISKEMWEQCNHMYWQVQNAAQQSNQWTLAQFYPFFEEIKKGTQLFFGIVDATITRNEGWHFGRLGRMIERSDKITRFLDIKYFTLLPDIKTVDSPLDILYWTAVLKSASAYNMFRQQYQGINPMNIAEFLLLDKDFPRSVLFCTRYAFTSLYEISGHNPLKVKNEPEKLVGKLRSSLEHTEINDIFKKGLHEFLDDFQQKNNALGNAISETYFALKPITTVS